VTLNNITEVCPRGVGASALRTTTANSLGFTSPGRLYTTLSMANGIGITLNSCATPGCCCNSNLTTSRSEETAVYRWDEDVVIYRKRVGRCMSSPQVVPRRRQCTCDTLRCVFLYYNRSTPLTDSPRKARIWKTTSRALFRGLPH